MSDMEHRHLGGVHGEQHLDDEPGDVRSCRLGVPAKPVLEGDGVESGGLRGLPGRVGRNAQGSLVEQGPQLGRPRGADEIVALPALDASADVEEVCAHAVGGKRLQAELPDQLRHRMLGRPHPLAAELDHRTAAQILVQQLPADSLTSLDHDDVDACGGEVACRGEPREAGADDHDIPHEVPPSVVALEVPGRRDDSGRSATAEAYVCCRRQSSAARSSTAVVSASRATSGSTAPG